MAIMSKVRTLYTVYSIYSSCKSESTDRKTTYDGTMGTKGRSITVRKFRNSLIDDVPTYLH